VVGSQVPEQVDDLAAGGGIEIAGRLVGEHDARLDRERARDRDPLPLASGQVPRQVVGVPRQVVGARSQPDLVEQPQRAVRGSFPLARASLRRSRPRSRSESCERSFCNEL
jgi:hypothetical protein